MRSQRIPTRVFCSSAPEDMALCQQLHGHLRPLEREGLLTFWHNRLITAGMDWAKTIDSQLNNASIILLLISPAFFASDYCYGVEMQAALKRHQAHEGLVIPILLRPVDWQVAPFAHLPVLPTNRKPITNWRNRNAAFANVAIYIRQLIQNPSSVALTGFSIAYTTRYNNVPYFRNPFFTGHEDLLAMLARALNIDQLATLSHPQAMSGLGGVGKTHLAIEYAHRHARDYEAIFWIPAASHDLLLFGFVELANILQLPERNEPDQSKSVVAVKRWLQDHNHWLLILDNVDDLSLLPDFLPTMQTGHILLTTRAQALGGLANRIEVNILDQSSGILLLLRRAGLLPLDAPLNQASEMDLLGVKQLWLELGGLPLALDQAGAYIEETHCSVPDYLQLFRTQRIELLKQRGGIIRDHPESVYTTFTLAFNAVSHRSAAAADLLRNCALLHPDAIPEEIFRQGANYLGSRLEAVGADMLAWNKVLATLGAYSLLQRQPEKQMLSMHRLVQAVLIDTIPASVQDERIKRIIAVLNALLPPPPSDYTTWKQCERLVPQALNCATYTLSWVSPDTDLASLLYKAADYLHDRVQYAQAEALLLRVLDIREQMYGPDHLDVASTLKYLAIIYRKWGKYAEAEPLLLRAFYIQKQTLGSNHPDVASSLNNLANIYSDWGKYEQVESLLLQALSIYEHLSSNDYMVAYPLDNLARLYTYQGKYEQAELLLQRALHIWEQANGPGHSRVARALNSLAELYVEQGKYEQAEPLFLRTLHIREQALEPKHPDTAETLHNFAALREAQGKSMEATLLYQRALAIREQIFGVAHQKTEVTRTAYTTLLRAMEQPNNTAREEEVSSEQPSTEEE